MEEDNFQINYYGCINPETGEFYGRYSGRTCKQAASKAFTKFISRAKMNNMETNETNIFLYKKKSDDEDDSDFKIYAYNCKQIMLDTPEKVTIKSGKCTRTIEYRKRNEIRKINVPDDLYELVMRKLNPHLFIKSAN